MLRSLKQVKGCVIHAVDGDIGRAEEFYFDDERWVVRYIVVGTGGILGRRVLISPVAVREIHWEDRRIYSRLTQDQVRKSPDADTVDTFSRRKEIEYFRYYRWPVYWGGIGLWGNGMYPAMLPDAMITDEEVRVAKQAADREAPKDDEIHLRSTEEVGGYHIQARDGEIGHVEDFLIDGETWAIRFMVIDTRNWLSGKKVLVEPGQIARVDWYDSKVHVDLPRGQIQEAPQADYDSLG